MLKRTKPGLVSSNSSARLLEDVLADRDNYDHPILGSRVRHLYTPILLRKTFEWNVQMVDSETN